MRIQHTLTAFVFASLMPLAALAQQQAPATVQAPPPPQTMPLEEGEAPAVTIPGGERREEIIEHRKQGRVTEVEVHTPSSSYTVRPNEQRGSSLPGDAESNSNRGAQFTIKRFPVPKPKNEEEAEAAVQPGAPAAPTAPAASGAAAAPIAK